MRAFGLIPALLLLIQAPSQAEEQLVPTVIVTATRTAETADETLSSVTVITRDDIERQQAQSVQDLLRGVPGVQISTSGGLGKASSVFMRGTNEDQVLVLIDGVKVGSATLGTTPFENLPLAEIERIEVVRGPRSSLYGSEAIGGVIQIFTRRGEGPLSPTVSLGAGSFSTRRASAGLSEGDRNFWFNLSASYLDSGGFNVRDGTPLEPDADGYDNTAISFRAGRRLENGVEAELHLLRSDGFTEFDGGFVNEADLLQQVFGVRLSFAPTDFWYARLLAGRSTDEQENFKDGTPRTRFDTDRDTLTLLNDLSFGDAHLLTLGFDLQRDRVDSTTVFTENERTNAGTFGQLSTTFRNHALLLAARLDDNEQFGEETTGSVAWGWSPASGVRLRASYGTAFKAPSFNQLFFPGFGNPALDPERSKSAEIGARADTQFGEFSLSAYRTDVEDLIVFDPITFFPQNIARARIHGVEFGYSIRRQNWLLDATLDLLDPENRAAGADRGNVLPRRARRTLSINAHREFGDFRLGARLIAEGHRFDDIANRRRLDGYATLDLLGGYAIDRDWRLQIRIENVLDRDYQTAASFNQRGRSVFFTLRYQARARRSP